MLQIAICDDEKTETEYLSGLLTAWSKRRLSPIELHCFSSAEQFLYHRIYFAPAFLLSLLRGYCSV